MLPSFSWKGDKMLEFKFKNILLVFEPRNMFSACALQRHSTIYTDLRVCLYCYLSVCASLSNTGSLACVRHPEVLWVQGPQVSVSAHQRDLLGLRHGERTAEPRGEVPLSNSLRACRPNPGHLGPVNPSSSSDHTHSHMLWDATDVCVCGFIGMWVFVKTNQIK